VICISVVQLWVDFLLTILWLFILFCPHYAYETLCNEMLIIVVLTMVKTSIWSILGYRMKWIFFQDLTCTCLKKGAENCTWYHWFCKKNNFKIPKIFKQSELNTCRIDCKVIEIGMLYQLLILFEFVSSSHLITFTSQSSLNLLYLYQIS